MQLPDERQPIEQRVQRRAKDKVDGDKGQQRKEPYVAPGDTVEMRFLAVATTAPADQGDERQEIRQDAQVAPRFDIVFSDQVALPGDLSDPLAQGVDRHRHPAPGKDVKVAVVGRAAVKVRHKEGNDLAQLEGPVHDLIIGGRPLTKVLRPRLVKRHELRRAQGQAQAGHQHQPAANAKEMG